MPPHTAWTARVQQDNTAAGDPRGEDGLGRGGGSLDMPSPGRREYGKLSYAGRGSVPYQREI